MKQVAIGRKNWLFAGSVAGGGERTAGFLTLVSSAMRGDLDVWQYAKTYSTSCSLARLTTSRCCRGIGPPLIQKRSAGTESTSEKSAPNASSSNAKTAVRSDSRLLDPSTHA